MGQTLSPKTWFFFPSVLPFGVSLSPWRSHGFVLAKEPWLLRTSCSHTAPPRGREAPSLWTHPSLGVHSPSPAEMEDVLLSEVPKGTSSPAGAACHFHQVHMAGNWGRMFPKEIWELLLLEEWCDECGWLKRGVRCIPICAPYCALERLLMSLWTETVCETGLFILSHNCSPFSEHPLCAWCAAWYWAHKHEWDSLRNDRLEGKSDPLW